MHSWPFKTVVLAVMPSADFLNIGIKLYSIINLDTYNIATLHFAFIVYCKFFNIGMLFADSQTLEFTFVGCHANTIQPLNALGCVYFN